MNDTKAILLKILEIIGYTDDKEAFATEFTNNIQMQSILDLIETLPADQQAGVKQKLTDSANNPEAIASILKEHFTQEQLQQSLQKSAKQAFTEYIQAISTSLSTEQKQNL